MHRLIYLLFACIICPALAFATPLRPEQVPEPLKPWVNWVLEDHPEQSCPFLYQSLEQKRCSWPSAMQLSLSANRGVFTSHWLVYADSWVSLPGDSKHWPLQVSVNRQAALVMERNGVPSIKLLANGKQPMAYEIKGEFLWDAMPENLTLPEDTGLINVAINGVNLPSPTIRAGQLWLKAVDTGQNQAQQVENSIDVQVFRQITDTVPVEVLTRLVVEVSGVQREIKLAKPLLANFLPLSISSPLPARIEPDGQLLLQVRPGIWQIEVLARNSQELQQLAAPAANVGDSTWPASEIWVFAAHPELRTVEIQQANAIDGSQTNLPEDWKALPAYSMEAGQTMTFKTIRRGDPEPEANQLTLHRKLWLDFDGGGYTVNDTITGVLNRSWRLNALPETHLGKVSLDGGNQLVTLEPNSSKQGVEMRKGEVNLDADSRISGAVGKLDAVGWEQQFQSLSAELNLPPGWRLIAASGVDNVPDSWISKWTLLDLFLVLIAALATARLWQFYWGIFALITLMLCWHEAEAPHLVWLNILAATALLRVLPAGKAFNWFNRYRQLSWLALVFIAIPFMVDQVRTGLYPQLEVPQQNFAAPQLPMSAPVPAQAMQELKARSEDSYNVLGKAMDYSRSVAEKSEAMPAKLKRLDPDAKVQTGPGLPQWQWHKILLSWHGAVDPGQQLHLWYLSPTLAMFLNFFRVIAICLLALLMFGLIDKHFTLNVKLRALPVWLWLVLLPILATPSPNAYAEMPDPALLAELKTRLAETTPPDCLPACAEIPQMQVTITDKSVDIHLQILAQENVALPLPADYSQWFPNQVLVDGAAAAAMYRENNGLWLNLKAGAHQVVLKAVAPLLAKFTLPLPLKPKHVSVKNNGWEVQGLLENGWSDEQLQFTRSNQDHNAIAKTGIEPGQLPSFVRIERRLAIGLDWRVTTRIIRVSPADSAILLSVPLLAGEAVTTAGIRVKDGHVEASLSAQQSELEWQSSLEKSASITLTAPATDQWVEVWQADISPIWHVETSGIAMMRLNSDGQWLPEWHPWPGESISLQIARPEAVAGQTVTIDHSQLSLRPGQRSRDTSLSFNLRSSQASQHTLTLPEKSVLQAVSINGQSQPLQLQGRKLVLPINPGSQSIEVTWQEPTALGFLLKTPVVDLGIASVNHDLQVSLPQDRWLLGAFGPKLGPAVLFWGVLLVLFILSLGLQKMPLVPLRDWQWFLLLLGLSQIPMEMASMVVAWFAALAWRSKRASSSRYFNETQIILAGFTLIALGVLFFAVAQGLLNAPDMQVIGNQSSAFNLNWYQDRSLTILPTATVVSVPLWVYRLLMLAWSLWLAMSLLQWLKWGWMCFSRNDLWIKAPAKPKSPPEKTPQ